METSDRTTTADALLARIQEQDRPRLRVYIGAAPGVGKTYAMLREAHALRARGLDVVAGLIETYGRQDTEAQIGDLEVVPRRQIEYRGTTLEEMTASLPASRMCASSTSWRTPMRLGAATANATRT